MKIKIEIDGTAPPDFWEMTETEDLIGTYRKMLANVPIVIQRVSVVTWKKGKKPRQFRTKIGGKS